MEPKNLNRLAHEQNTEGRAVSQSEDRRALQQDTVCMAQAPESDEDVLRRLLNESELRHGNSIEQRALIGALRNLAITPMLQARSRELTGYASRLDDLLGDPAKSPTTPDGKHITVSVDELLTILRPLRHMLVD